MISHDAVIIKLKIRRKEKMKRTHILGSILVAAGLAMSTGAYFQGQLAQAKTYNYKVATIKQEPYVLLNDDEGKTIVDRALLAGTDWQVGKIANLNHNGTLYYQVSTHEWVNSAAVQANFDPQTGTLLTGEMQPNQTPSNTTQPNQALIGKINSTVVEVYTNNGQTVNTGDPRFTMNSAWKVNRVVKNSQGKSFYLVGNDTWISSDDMELNQAPQNVENIPNFGINASINNNTNNNSGSTINSDNTSNSTNKENKVTIVQHESPAAYQQAILNAINAKRAALGLQPLTINEKLTRAATIRTTEQYNDPKENENTTGPRPDGSNWWSVLSEVDYDWSYARECNFLLSDSYNDLSQLNTPEKVTKALMLLYEGAGYDDNYLSPKAKEMGASVRYSDKPGLTDKVYTVIEVGAPK